MFKINALITHREVVALNTTAIHFDVGSSFSFVPGQYVTITLPGFEQLDRREKTHDFSITSSPTQLPTLIITFRNSQSVFKQTLLDKSFDKPIQIEGPKGLFALPPERTPICFVAGGIGITPFMSMIRFIRDTQLDIKPTLYYFNHNSENTVYLCELEAASKFLTLHALYERPSAQNIRIADHDPQTVWYVSGPIGLIDTTLAILRQAGVAEPNIRTEEFFGYA